MYALVIPLRVMLVNVTPENADGEMLPTELIVGGKTSCCIFVPEMNPELTCAIDEPPKSSVFKLVQPLNAFCCIDCKVPSTSEISSSEEHP